ncbi:MAG: hypothetical protein ACOX3G_11595 [Armatimonadota bacterium]
MSRTVFKKITCALALFGALVLEPSVSYALDGTYQYMEAKTGFGLRLVLFSDETGRLESITPAGQVFITGCKYQVKDKEIVVKAAASANLGPQFYYSGKVVPEDESILLLAGAEESSKSPIIMNLKLARTGPALDKPKIQSDKAVTSGFLVGKYQYVEENMTGMIRLLFNENGTCVLEMKPANGPMIDMDCTYQLQGNDVTVTVRVPHSNTTILYKGSVADDRQSLVITRTVDVSTGQVTKADKKFSFAGR